jgi:hypothetical protein
VRLYISPSEDIILVTKGGIHLWCGTIHAVLRTLWVWDEGYRGKDYNYSNIRERSTEQLLGGCNQEADLVRPQARRRAPADGDHDAIVEWPTAGEIDVQIEIRDGVTRAQGRGSRGFQGVYYGKATKEVSRQY